MWAGTFWAQASSNVIPGRGSLVQRARFTARRCLLDGRTIPALSFHTLPHRDLAPLATPHPSSTELSHKDCAPDPSRHNRPQTYSEYIQTACKCPALPEHWCRCAARLT